MAKAQGEFARKLRALEAVYEVKREGINNNAELDEATKKKQLSDLDIQFNTDKEYYLIKGGDVSDFFKLGSQGELIKAANRAAKKQIKQEGIGPDSPNYLTRLAELQAQYLAIMTQQFGKQFAEGGAVTTDVNVMAATPQGIDRCKCRRNEYNTTKTRSTTIKLR